MGHARARLVLPVIYLCAWAASILAIWMADTVGLMGAIILWLYLVMPAVTLGTSVAAALLNPYGRATWLRGGPHARSLPHDDARQHARHRQRPLP